MQPAAVKRIVNSFKNKDGEIVRYIIDCPLKQRFFRGGPNVGRSYAAPSMCEECRYNIGHERGSYFIGDNEIESPWLSSIVCNG